MSFISKIHLIYLFFTTDISTKYLFAFAASVTLWLLFRIIYRLVTYQWRSTSLFVLKHLVYPYVFRRIPLVGAATRGEVLVVLLYLVVNCVLVTLVGVKSVADIGTRAANMSIVNLIPLLCGPRLTLMTQFLGISSRVSLGSHQWFGRTAIAQVLLHAVISVTANRSFPWTDTNIFAVVGGSVLGFILFLSMRLVRRLFYELFLNSHLFLSFIVLFAIWRHVSSKKPAELFIQAGVSLWVSVSIIHWILFAFRNFVWGKPFAIAIATCVPTNHISGTTLVETSDITRVDVTVPRAFTPMPGQHVFLSIPTLGLMGLRGHPFLISWWNRDQKGLTVSLLIKTETGFTKKLKKHLNQVLYVYIDGPYGVQHNLGEFGTVIMFATGIGIAGHMSYIRNLITRYNSCEIQTRRIILVWQVQTIGQMEWVEPWIDEVLENDTGCIISFYLYIQESKGDEAYGTHPKIEKIPGVPPIASILQNEFRGHRGRIIVSVCANHIMADKVRSEVRHGMDDTVRLVKLDFEPSLSEKSSSWDMEFQCRG